MALNAGDIVWNIGANLDRFEKAMGKASKQGRSLGKSLVKNSRAIGVGFAAAGGAITAFLGSSVKNFTATGDAIHKMAIRTGASTEALSELGFAAEQSGASLETIGKAFKAQADFIEDAKDGLSTSTVALDKLGLSLEDLQGKTPEQVFMTLSSAIGGLADPMERAAIANDVFKRSGQELIPLFAAGADGIANMRAEAQQLGISMSQEQAEAAAKFGDSMNSLKQSMMGVGIQIGTALVPILTTLVEKVTPVITKLSKWAAENPKLTQAVLIVAGAVGAFMLAVAPLLIMLPGLATAFSAVSAIVPIVGAVIAALTGPIGIIIAIVVALTVIIVRNWDKVKEITSVTFQFIGFLFAKVFNGIKDVVSGTVDFVIKAIDNMLGWIFDAIRALTDLIGLTSKAGGGGGNRQSKATGGTVKGFASGGKTKNAMVKVGERGSEIAALPVGTRVLSHPDMMRAVSQGASTIGGGSPGGGKGFLGDIKPVFNITIMGEQDPNKLMDKLKTPFSLWMRDELKSALL